jgi:SAM-dependent methyltransferase
MQDNQYFVDIIRGHSDQNDYIIDFLKPRIVGDYLDIGCNSGWLLSEVPGGMGVDLSKTMVRKANDKGLKAFWMDAADLNFYAKSFDTAILSCILEQCENWQDVLMEAMRVGKRVIGTNPVPGSKWGVIGGCVKSVIAAEDITSFARHNNSIRISIEPMLYDRYFFRILM